MHSNSAATLRLYRRALAEARSYWPHLGLILLLGLLWTPIALLVPLPVKIVVDSVLGSAPLPAWLADLLPAAWLAGSASLLHVALGLAALVALLTVAHQMAEWLLREYTAERMVLDFRSKIFLRTLQASLLQHDAKGAHDRLYRISLDAPALQWTALYGIIPVITAMVTLVSTLYVTSLLSLSLALLALATSVPLIALIHFNQVRMRDKWHSVKELESAAQSVVQEALGALRVVTAFGQERHEQGRFVERSCRGLRAKLRVIRLESLFGTLLGLSTGFGTIAVLYLGVREVQAQALSVGELLLITGYIGQLYAPLQQIGTHITAQQRAIVSAERAFELLDEPPGVEDRPDGRPLARASGALRFDDVSFTLPNGRTVFSGLDVEVPAGACVGIVGPTGSGKSTLANLLIRMFDPTSGRIQLDGIDLREYRLTELRRQFAVVSQEPVLFSTTIAENIAYADPDAAMEQIIAAARLAHAHEFIEALPQGYQTKVGERGAGLSGGERQRLSLARAFLKDAPLLILDEPTSSIDLQTERNIVASIEQLMQGRTTFMIAHRLSTLRNADLILRVEQGGVTPELPQNEVLQAS